MGAGMALFQNAQWAVTDWGMEAAHPEPPYEFEAERFTETTVREAITYYDWPVHLAEKDWVDIESFIEAFSRALDLNSDKYNSKVDPDMLNRSFVEARRIAAKR